MARGHRANTQMDVPSADLCKLFQANGGHDHGRGGHGHARGGRSAQGTMVEQPVLGRKTKCFQSTKIYASRKRVIQIIHH